MANKLDQFVDVSIDVSSEDVLQWDADGKRLRFKTGIDEFKKLEPLEVRKLSEFGKLSYSLALKEYEENLDLVKAEEEELLSRIQVGVSMGSASQRLQVNGKQNGMAYAWIRPDMVDEYLAPNKGWSIVKGGSERTLGNRTGHGPHVIGTKGSEELLLVRRSAAADRAESKAKRLRRQRELGHDPAKDAIEDLGIKAVSERTTESVTLRQIAQGEEE